MIGQTVSHYKILEKIGEGGMGIVYKAEDTKLLRSVALKFLPPEMTRDLDAKKRFIQEARAASKLDHPNIAVVHEVDETDDGHSFICMAYYDGQTLKSRLARSPLSIEEAVRIALQIASGLQRAHESGIVHRDIKPGNIIITLKGEVKIVDFGLAKLAAQTHETRSQITGGTAAYMAPEQILGSEADARSDLFSLGVVLYEAAAGRRPFVGEHEAALFYSIVNAEPAPPSTLRTEISPELESIILRLLEKDPKKRYQSASDLREDLKHFLGEQPTPRPVIPLQKILGSKFSTTIVSGVVVIIATAILFATGLLQKWVSGPQTPEAKLIGVLPFTNISSDSSSQALCDGLFDRVANGIARLQALLGDSRVIAASETRQYRKPSDARRGLGIAYAIEGSFHSSPQEIEITVALIDAKSLINLDSRTVKSPMAVTSQLESDIIRSIAEMIGSRVRSADLAGLSEGSTQDQKAYELYLEGRGYLQKYQVTQNVDKAIESFKNAVQKDQSYALAYAGLGEACWRKFEATKDIQWTRTALEFCQRAITLDDALAPVHITMGIIQKGSGRYVEAVEQYQRALAIDSLNSDAYRELASAYQDLNDPAKAEGAYKKAITLKPNYWAGYSRLGVFYYRRGRNDDAILQFKRAIELWPENYTAFNTLGGLYFYVNRFDEAKEMFEHSLAIEPNNYVAHSQLGTLYFYQQRFADAAAEYEKALKLKDTDYQKWGFLASAYQWSGADPSKMRKTFERAIAGGEQLLSVNPHDADLLRDLADYRATLGDRKTALNLLEQALHFAPENIKLIGRSASVYEELGDRTMALKMLERAVKNGYSLTDVERDPAMKALRGDPRYAELRKADVNRSDKK